MATSVLYITSRYPKVTETFVVNEWLTLRSRFDMHLAALRRTENRSCSPMRLDCCRTSGSSGSPVRRTLPTTGGGCRVTRVRTSVSLPH